MIENVLWIAVALMVISSVIPNVYRIRKLIGGIGWGFFSLHWAYQPFHYIGMNDYANVVLTIAVAIFCALIVFVMIKEYSQEKPFSPGSSIDVTSMATSAMAIGSLFYFPFARMPSLNVWIISGVTNNVMWVLDQLNVPAQMVSWNMISLNNYHVEIILACTAIESIALFIGLIASVKAPARRLAAAFLASVPVIYILNIIRDVFVVIAYGEQWFGPNSFEIAHHMIAKAGSGIALFVIAYTVLRILPELLEMIDGLWRLITNQVHSVVQKVAGNH